MSSIESTLVALRVLSSALGVPSTSIAIDRLGSILLGKGVDGTAGQSCNFTDAPSCKGRCCCGASIVNVNYLQHATAEGVVRSGNGMMMLCADCRREKGCESAICHPEVLAWHACDSAAAVTA